MTVMQSIGLVTVVGGALVTVYGFVTRREQGWAQMWIGASVTANMMPLASGDRARPLRLRSASLPPLPSSPRASPRSFFAVAHDDAPARPPRTSAGHVVRIPTRTAAAPPGALGSVDNCRPVDSAVAQCEMGRATPPSSPGRASPRHRQDTTSAGPCLGRPIG